MTFLARHGINNDGGGGKNLAILLLQPLSQTLFLKKVRYG